MGTTASSSSKEESKDSEVALTLTTTKKRKLCDPKDLVGLTCRLHPTKNALVPMVDFVEGYKTVYLKKGKNLSNAVAILTLQVPITARIYDSEGTPWSLHERTLPDEKFATSHAFVSEARIVGSPNDVVRGVEGYMAGSLRLQSAFQVHNGSAYYYEVGEWVEENNAGKKGKNGCVQGIYGFNAMKDAFEWTVQMYKSKPHYVTKVSKAITEPPEKMDEWFRWNDRKAKTEICEETPSSLVEKVKLLFSKKDKLPKCLSCTRTLSTKEAEMTYKPCGHKGFCSKCRSAQLGAGCPICATPVIRADRWKAWANPVKSSLLEPTIREPLEIC